MRRFATATFIAVSILFAVPALASADEWQPVVQSCVTTAAVTGCDAANFNGGWDVAVSPDGKTAYGVAFSTSVVVSFDRDPATGRLTPKPGASGCVTDAATAGCIDGRALEFPTDVEVSRDGKSVYVASDSGGIAVFDRNASNGVITQKGGAAGCFTFDGSDKGAAGVCTDARGFPPFQASGPFALRVSRDGKNVYSTTFDGAILAFDRNATTGALTQKAGTGGCVREDGGDGCFNGTAVGFARQFAIAPDGRHVYFPTSTKSGVLIFDRNTTTGTLTQKADKDGCITFDGTPEGGVGPDLCQEEPRLAGRGVGVEISPDGQQLYVPVDDKVLVFNRLQDGRLSFASCVNDLGNQGCSAGRNLTDLFYAGFSPDGEDLVINNGFAGNGLAIFRRNPATGALTQPSSPDGCVTSNGTASDNGGSVPNSCRSHPRVGLNGHVTWVDNNRFYVGFFTQSTVLGFKREFAPVCRGGAAEVPHNTTVPVQLACSDRNGDAISLQVTQAPRAGLLGAIDQGAGRVFYGPFTGFSGGDSFTYRGVAAGVASAPATINVTVGPAPIGPGLDADRDGFFAGQDCRDDNPKINPSAKEIRGNRTDEDCDGRAQPFLDVRSTVTPSWFVQGGKFTLQGLLLKNLLRGTKVGMSCKGAGCPFKAKPLTAKKVKAGNLQVIRKVGARVFGAGQTVTFTFRAARRNTKLAIFKLKAGKLPVGVAKCRTGAGGKLRRCR